MSNSIDFAQNHKPPAVFIKLIILVCQFLAICLNRITSLPERYDFFSRVAILYNQTTGISASSGAPAGARAHN